MNYCGYFWGVRQGNYSKLVYFIAATIIATIALQLYWNIQNYQANKQRLINEVQISLDNGLEAYFAELAKTDVFAFIDNRNDSLQSEHRMEFWNSVKEDSVFLKIKTDTLNSKTGIQGFTTLLDSGKRVTQMKIRDSSIASIFRGKGKIDSIASLKGLANKIIVSITRDTLDFERLDTIFSKELGRKNISIGYQMKHLKNDSALRSFSTSEPNALVLSTLSKSTYLPQDEKLELLFTNPTLTVLKRSTTGILLSFLLSACIITCLLYLLRIIKRQKQLALIKNDLISNITHEFKTPIATVSTALEGIKSFNQANNKEKTKKYLDISGQQLRKLHQMVEKLLETATLDSDQLLLQKESLDLIPMLKDLAERYQMLAETKELRFSSNKSQFTAEVDPFHFENAIANLIDNAIKYGGNSIEINVNALLNKVEITVADDGGYIDSSEKEKIFDKFYRIPTGNRHDVKGFGIGLFYSKKIIEKHGGTIQLTADKKNTAFKITL